MRLRTIILLILFFNLWAAQANAKSFNALGSETTVTYYQKLIKDLSTWNESSSWSDTKRLRKDIGNAKLLIDLFTPIYPKTYPGESEKDFLLSVRDLLDEGYEKIGKYKDLYDSAQITQTEINQEEKKELYKISAKWVKAILKKDKKDKIENFLNLSFTTTEKFYARKQNDLPKYIWARLQREPEKQLSGEENLRLVVSELMWLASQDLDKLLTLEDLTPHENEETFHDWRKTVRMVLKINDFFNNTVTFNSTPSALNKLDHYVDEFGSLNDNFIQYHKEGNQEKLEKLKNKINAKWLELKNNLKDDHVKELLESESLNVGEGLL